MGGAVKAFAYARLPARISLNTSKTSCYSVRSVSTVDMYGSRGGRGGRGPNSHHRGRGGGGRGRGGGGGGERGRGGVGGGARGGGGGEQRWWDPAWRKQRLEQMRVEVEKLDENEWWRKMEELKDQDQQEIIIKSNYGREGAAILEDMAFQMGLHFHAYNKGRNTVLVVSKVPLPNYRADLDEKHGSTHRQINLSAATENRVEKMLANAKVDDSSSSKIARVVTYGATGVSSIFEEPLSVIGTDGDMEKLNLELHNKQIRLMANPAVKSMISFREKLPAYKMKSDILRAIKENQVVVVSGETGCGKTTQLPQLILEESIELLKGAQCNIICTQPRRVSAISVAARVCSERGDQLGETIGYQIRMESKRSRETRLLYCTTGVLLRRLVQDPDLKGVSHVIVDEIHERGINEDFLIIVLRDLLQKRSDLRLILMSATINADLFSQYFDNAPMINIPGFTFDVRELYLEDVLETTRHVIISDTRTSHFDSRKRGKQMDQKKDSMVQLFEDINIDSQYGKYSSQTRRSLEAWDGSRIDFDLIQSSIMHICSYEGDGAILVFLTGWDDISKLLDILKENNILSDRKHFLLLPLHGSMPTVSQQEIFQRPPNGIRKIILATNIAETSITIDDVVFVIDCGKAKETSYDALNKLACLTPSWISKASARQRRGRAGRVQPGVCYRLYPKVIYDAMPEYQLPEMLRTPLQELCLQIKSLHLGKVSDFLSKALQPPEPLAVANALELLKTIGALNENEDLTSLGCHLSVLPLDPKVGKMLLMGAVFQCLEPALIIAAALAYRDPFVLPIDKKEEADDAKISFAGDSLSDHICLLRAFKSWKAAQYNGQDVRRFCYENFLSMSTLQLMDDMQKQFRDLLCDIGFIDKQLRLEAYNQYSGNFEMVSAILCAGLFPNVVQCKRRGKRSAFFTKEDGKVDIHPASVNSRVASFPLPYLVYSNKVKTTGIFIRDSTNISDHALLMFGGSFTPGQNDRISMLGDYLHFSASKKTLQLVQTLRAELDNLLQRKIREPSLDITRSGKDIVSAVLEFLNSKTEQ